MGYKVNKNDLVARVAELSGLASKDAVKAVDGVFDAITEALASDGEVRLTGFGIFEVVKRAASKGRNPRTGAEIDIPASKGPKFRPGQSLKNAVAGTNNKTTTKKTDTAKSAKK